MDSATPPYAYVVDYRPLDACSPPSCHVKGRSALGFAREIQSDGDPGAYVTAGPSLETEFYYRRGIVLRPHEKYEFTLPPGTSPREFDAYLWASLGGQSWRANVVFSTVEPGGGGHVDASSIFEGKTPAFSKAPAAMEGVFGRYAKHVRLPLPARPERPARLVRVAIENVGAEKLSIGTPVVMRRVEGRGPRQIVFALFDAVPFHLLDAALHGDTGEARTAWLHESVAKNGVYFPDAVSPAQATVSFLSRFTSGELWPGRGWPGMFGMNAVDESIPEELHGPVVKLGEDGFLTELAGNNFTLAPALALTGFDGGYQLESDTHAAAIEHYVAAWAEEHARDDAMLLLWNAQTHSPYAQTRATSAPPLPKEIPASEVNGPPNAGVWRNLMDGVDHLKTELEALRRGAPDANRLVWIGADHSRGITMKMKHRAFRALRGFGEDLSHGTANTVEEMRTPYALLFDGPPRPATLPPVVAGVSSTLGVWRAVESTFGLDLELTPSTTFDHPLFEGARPQNPWVDRIFVGAGIAGSLRVVSPSRHLAYGYFSPTPTGGTLWALPAAQQKVMLGAPSRNGFVVAEELYDESADPYELASIANERFADVLDLRRELVDFVATHYDPPDHPRNVYVLQLAERTNLRISALGKLRVLVDGVPVLSSDPHAVEVVASKLELVESEDPLGVVEVASLDRKAPLVLRCAANGLMLDQMSADRPRLSLALARTNCPLPATGREVTAPGEILFTVRKAQRFEMGSSPTNLPNAGPTQGGVGDDLLAGMKRWGYVRDIDENKP